MRKLFIIMMIVAYCCRMLGQVQNVATQTDVDKRVGNCVVMLGIAIDMVFKEQPIFDARAYADTLYNYLYKKPIEMKSGSKYMGKIFLQAFFALSEDARIDYPDIEKCLAVTGKYEAFYTLPFIVCAYYYSQWAEQQQLTDKSIAAMQLGLKAHDKLYPDSTTVLSQTMNIGLSRIYYDHKKWGLASKYAKRMLDDQRRLGNAGSDEYYEMLSLLASCFQMSGKKVKADSCLQLVQRYMEQGEHIDGEKYVNLLINRAELQESLGNYGEAEKLLLQSKNGLIVTDELYHETMLGLANLYTEQQQFEKAMSVVQQELSFYEKSCPTDVRMLFPWIVFCNNPLSTNEGQRLVAMLEKMQNGEIMNMAVLAYAYCHTHKYEKARQKVNQIEYEYTKLSVSEQEALLDYLQPLYAALNDFDRQIALGKQQVAAIEKVVGNRHNLYAQTLALLGNIYALKGDYYHGLQMLDSCVNIQGIDLTTQINAYEGMSEIFANMGDYKKSNHYASVLLKHTDDVTMKHKFMGRIIINLISELEIRRFDADEQDKTDTDSLRHLLVDYATKSLEFCRSHFGEGHLNTIEAMEFLASAYYLSNDTLLMKQTAEACEQNIQRYLKNPLLQKTYLQALSIFYQKCHQYQKAIELVDTSCLQNPNAMIVEIRGTLEPLAELNLNLGRHAQAQYYFSRLAKAIMDETSNQMVTLTSQARQYYWRLSRHTLAGAAKFVQQKGLPDSFVGTIYDLAIYSKGILLGSEQAFTRAVRSTGDEMLKEKMRQMMDLRTAIVQSAMMTDMERTAKAKYAEQLERELLSACGDAMKNLLSERLPGWHEIQQALPDSAMAIEMVQYTTHDVDYYGAVLLRSNWLAPVFVDMGTKSQFDAMTPEDLSIEAGRKIWQFMNPYQDSLRTIYFSPIGIFHKLPIEYMPYCGSEVLSEHFHVYRLSSTLQLVASHNEQGKDAVVYGGLDYGISVKEMEQDAKQYNHRRGAGDVEELEYLKGTEIEAESILKLINDNRQAGMTAKMFSGKAGTESSFKAFNGQRKRVMHIGTHGFYAANDIDNDSSPLVRNLQQYVNNEDKSLMQSGLYLAGAGNRLNHETIPDSIDDGILTAQEVSALDLRGLELITLSACQTAQGRITSDGVFGLQRGFKKAGAQSILMSLWKVDDEATCLLMTEFYRNWIDIKMSKHDAIEAAKKTVRSYKEKGWDNPKFWAAFILLDGLN